MLCPRLSTGCDVWQRPEAHVESPGMKCGMEPGPGRNPAPSCPESFHPRTRSAQNHADWSRQAGVLTEERKRKPARPSEFLPAQLLRSRRPAESCLAGAWNICSLRTLLPVSQGRSCSHQAAKPCGSGSSHERPHLPRTDSPPPTGLLRAPRPSNPTFLTPPTPPWGAEAGGGG